MNIIANPLPSMSRAEIIETILTYRDKFVLSIEGEPGQSKSAIFNDVAAALGDAYVPLFLTVPDLDVGDTYMTMPVRVGGPDGERTTLQRIVNDVFLTGGKPLFIFMDEGSKASGHMVASINALTHERRIGSYPLPDGTILTAAGNLGSDGVGDKSGAHSSNRVVRVHMRKPNMHDAVAYGASSGWHPAVLGWMSATPTAFDSYLDDPENRKNNPYAFNPKLNKERYVSMRSLEKASIICHGATSDGIKAALLSGAVGAAAGAGIATMYRLSSTLPKLADVIANPTRYPLTGNPSTDHFFVCNAAARDTLQTVGDLDAVMTYVERIGKEYGAMFYRLAQSTPHLLPLARNSRACRKYANDNTHLI